MMEGIMKPQIVSFPLSSFEAREIEWLWNSRIPFGCVTLLEGDGGVGKSSVIASIGSAVSVGKALPDDVAKNPMGVLLLAAEDDPSVVLRPRFEMNGADLDLVRCHDQAMLLNQEGLDFLRREIVKHRIALVVIDPIVSFLGQGIDASKATDVRSIMGPLHELAKEFGCAVVVVRHWNKSSQASASQRGSGSVDFRNAARSVLQVIKANNLRYVTLEKSNYGVDGKTLTFSLDNKIVNWTGASDMSADDILRESHMTSGDGASELDEAVAFLCEELKNGPVQSKSLEDHAKGVGISNATLRRARKKLGVHPFKEQGRKEWMCELPSASVHPDIGTPDHVQVAQVLARPQVEQDEQVADNQPTLFEEVI
jgi:hypothetical protein